MITVRTGLANLASKVRSWRFSRALAKAEKRFAALQKVEQRHAKAYQQVLENL